MPYTPATLIKLILNQRKTITDLNTVKQISKTLFDLAKKDKDAAKVLLAKDNRFLKVMPHVVTENELLEFSRIHGIELIEKFIRFTAIDKERGDRMRRAAFDKKGQDRQFDALIRGVQLGFINKSILQEGRTFQAIKYNSRVFNNEGIDGVKVNDNFIPIVTRKTRNFHQKLCSVGSASSREIIFLDPEDQLLKGLYALLKVQLQNKSDPTEILETVKELTRKCFPESKPDSYINRNLAHNRKIIPLSEFIVQRNGVCRHHTLLNAYFLSSLVRDGILKGEVIHHRQAFGKDGAHTWNIYRHYNGKVYSLDSLWNNITCITDNPNSIDRLYKYTVEAEINKMHFAQEVIKEPNTDAKHFVTCLERYIESKNWHVGYQFIPKNLPNNPEKRLPTYVALQFELIQKAKNEEITYEDAELKIKKLGRTAAEANNSCKYRFFSIRHLDTKNYYNLYLPDNENNLIKAIVSEMQNENQENKKAGCN